jgi:hypothetical protein
MHIREDLGRGLRLGDHLDIALFDACLTSEELLSHALLQVRRGLVIISRLGSKINPTAKRHYVIRLGGSLFWLPASSDLLLSQFVHFYFFAHFYGT